MGVMSDFLRLGVEMVVDRKVVKRRDGEGWPEERRSYHLLRHQVVVSKSQLADFHEITYMYTFYWITEGRCVRG